jgi:SAM-dependent methyltransferase
VQLSGALVCLRCRRELISDASSLRCDSCGERYPVVDGIADFSRGEYYDRYDAAVDCLSEEHERGLELEMQGSIRRIRDFYAPLIRERAGGKARVLDAGCGNGVSVDILREAGFDAWGNDLSQLRRHQWNARAARERLVVASALDLPFPDESFDAVISSGVLEHIGVAETPAPHYSVSALPNQRELRVQYLRELARVVAPDGTLFLDFPHGDFPIDFWHGNSPGSPRLHSTREPFLPTVREVRSLAREALGSAVVTARGPRGRLQFVQSSGHWYGKVLRGPMARLFALMDTPMFRWLAATPLNPFLVVEIRKRSRR